LNGAVSDDCDLLLRRLADGDETAMAEIVRQWQRPVLAYICRFLGCRDHEARDLAQEAFLRVWRSRDRWQPTARFSTWLFTIVSNLCRNRRRDLSRRPVLVALEQDEQDESAVQLPAPVCHDPHARAEAGELAARIRGAVAELPERQRAALLLRRFQAMSYKEISEVLGVTPGAVDSLLVRARRALSAALVEEPAQDSASRGVERICDGETDG
jgi:RNA polymerase sigma-70 factor (ECF subfamily)